MLRHKNREAAAGINDRGLLGGLMEERTRGKSAPAQVGPVKVTCGEAERKRRPPPSRQPRMSGSRRGEMIISTVSCLTDYPLCPPDLLRSSGPRQTRDAALAAEPVAGPDTGGRPNEELGRPGHPSLLSSGRSRSCRMEQQRHLQPSCGEGPPIRLSAERDGW